MFKRYPVFRFKPDDFKLKLREIKALYTSGLSMAAMMSLVFFGTLSLQCAINTFGQDIIVAHTAARKITEFSCFHSLLWALPWQPTAGRIWEQDVRPDPHRYLPGSDPYLDLVPWNDPFKLHSCPMAYMAGNWF